MDKNNSLGIILTIIFTTIVNALTVFFLILPTEKEKAYNQGMSDTVSMCYDIGGVLLDKTTNKVITCEALTIAQ